MRVTAAVRDRRATVDVTVASDRLVGYGTVRLAELLRRDRRECGPEPDRGIDVQIGVEIEAHPQARFVDLEEVTKPCDEHEDHPRVAVGESDLTFRLAALPGIEGYAKDQELPF